MQAEDVKITIIEVLDDSKAKEICVLDVQGITDITDYMIIASGTSSRHVVAVAGKVIDKMRDLGCRPLGTEGEDVGEWVLIDYGDVILHVMQPQTRTHYQLEKLWGDGGVKSEPNAAT